MRTWTRYGQTVRPLTLAGRLYFRHNTALRKVLRTALASGAKPRARTFLGGLSRDEMEYIAEFLGACILESARRSECSRAQFAERIAAFQQARGCSSPDDERKMILLLEFLCRT